MENMTKTQLENKIENLYQIIENYEEIAKTEIQNVLNTSLPNWKVASLDYGHLSLELVEDHTTRIEFYHGTDRNYKTEEETFKFDMNCSAFGSFKANDNTSSAWKYYTTIGKLLSDENLNNKFYEILHTLYTNKKEIRVELKKYQKKLREIKEAEEVEAYVNSQKSTLKNINFARQSNTRTKGYVVAKIKNFRGYESNALLAMWKTNKIYFPLADVFKTPEEAFAALKSYKYAYEKNDEFKVLSVKTINW